MGVAIFGWACSCIHFVQTCLGLCCGTIAMTFVSASPDISILSARSCAVSLGLLFAPRSLAVRTFCHGKDEQPAWVTDAHRRKRAVFANFVEVPQPAETQRIKEIADAVRHWSVCECYKCLGEKQKIGFWRCALAR